MLHLIVTSLLVTAQPPEVFSAHASAKQFEDGKYSSLIHYFDISCYRDQCQLEIITVNNCFSSAEDGTQTQRPYIERATTQDKTLKIDRRTPLVLEVSWLPDETTVAKLSFTREAGATTRFLGFVVKNSVILKKIINFTYVQTLKPVPAECPFDFPQ